MAKKEKPKKEENEVTIIPKKKTPNNHLIGWQRTNDIIRMLLDGKESKEIVAFVVDKYHVAASAANYYLMLARDEIKNHHNKQVDYVVSQHLERYEFLYHKLHELGAHTLAMTALGNKEKLMGMHKKDFNLKVTTTEMESTTMTIGSTYDEKKLDEKEVGRFQELLIKASTTK